MTFQTTFTTLASLITLLAVAVQSTVPIVIVARLLAVSSVFTFQTTFTLVASLVTSLAFAVQSTFPIVIVTRLLAVFSVTFRTTVTLVASMHTFFSLDILLAVCSVTF